MRKTFLGMAAVAVVAGGLRLGLAPAISSGSQQPIAPPAVERPAPLPPLAAGGKVVFLELGGEGCKPCEAMKPVMQAVREKFPDRVEVTFHDVRKIPAVAGQYGVRLIPTQVFLRADGTEFFRHEGYLPEDQVLAVLAKMGVE
ncbi:MAG: thioredoxin family protein [Deferrisomatales bacterium]|nr:thioredoxin family protein [Deferrisomatales bacterium]